MLWDGPEDGIATYNYQEEEDWSKTVAQCCLLDTIPQVLIKTSGSMLCTKAYTLSTNGDKSGSVLFTGYIKQVVQCCVLKPIHWLLMGTKVAQCCLLLI